VSGDPGFFSRWSRRKAGVPDPEPPPAAAPVAASVAPGPAAAPAPATAGEGAPAEPPPTLDDVAALDTASADFTRFVARDVDPTVKNAALKKLFADPQWNVMDGLDIYIDDYGKPSPLPESVLRQMVQAQFLGLFQDEEREAPKEGQNPRSSTDVASAAPSSPDEDPDLRLQPDDAARPGSDPPGPGEDAGRER
jgi:hypothetical protein